MSDFYKKDNKFWCNTKKLSWLTSINDLQLMLHSGIQEKDNSFNILQTLLSHMHMDNNQMALCCPGST